MSAYLIANSLKAVKTPEFQKYQKDSYVEPAFLTGKEFAKLLQDQVQLAGACTAAFSASGDVRYLAIARELVTLMDRDYGDPLGGYFDTAAPDLAAPALAIRTRQVLDDVLPGANAWAARVLSDLAAATGDSAYRRRAAATLEAFAGIAPEAGLWAPAISTPPSPP